MCMCILTLMVVLLFAIKNSVQGMCCGMAHLAGETTYNNSWQMILEVKTYGKSGKPLRKEVYNLAYSDGSHKYPITWVMGSVPMQAHLVQSLYCYYREF